MRNERWRGTDTLCRCDSRSRSLNGDCVGSSNASRAIARSSRSSIASSLSSVCMAVARWRCAYSRAVSHWRPRISSMNCCSWNTFNSNSDKMRKNVNSLPCCKVHRAALISVSLALSQTPVYTLRPHTGPVCHAVCLFMSQLSLVLTAPIHKGLARLSW